MTTALDELREDEIQALIALIELSEPVETPNNNSYTFHPETLEQARTYFRRFAVDLSSAFAELEVRGYARGPSSPPRLTPAGADRARRVRELRPPIWYWYRDFYTTIDTSAAFSRYCREVFGRDLSQHGFADMPQIDRLLDVLELTPSYRVLDVGCGSGKLAEYLSDRTGAAFTGVDYVPEAIEQARRRTRPKADRLRFLVGNLDTLEMPAGSFDAVTSVDSIFFGRSLRGTLERLGAALTRQGRMGILCGDDLGPVPDQMGIGCETHDLSRAHYEHLRLKRRVAEGLREEFESEGARFVWENLIAESIVEDRPFDPASGAFRRRLYLVRMP